MIPEHWPVLPPYVLLAKVTLANGAALPEAPGHVSLEGPGPDLKMPGLTGGPEQRDAAAGRAAARGHAALLADHLRCRARFYSAMARIVPLYTAASERASER